MRRKEPPLGPSATRGRSLIAMRTAQAQARKNQPKSQLPRSYSSSATHEPEPAQQSKGYVLRSYSSPEQKHFDYRRNSDSFYRPRLHGSRGELDSDLENFEQFEECFLDIDADQSMYGSERDEPRKVVTSLLPGSGLQRITIRPVSTQTTQSLQCAKDAMKKFQRGDKGASRLNFRSLVVKMPSQQTSSDHEQSSPGVEELQCSPQTELEIDELERQFDDGEQHLERDVAMATEESDGDTVSSNS